VRAAASPLFHQHTGVQIGTTSIRHRKSCAWWEEKP
jgi:hypothetical protein